MASAPLCLRQRRHPVAMRRLDTTVSCTAIMRDDGRRRRHQCAFEFSKLLHLLRRKFRFQRSSLRPEVL